MRRLILAAAFSLFSTLAAHAGSGCSSIVTGAVLTAAQWNACFSAKQNELGYTPVNKAGDSMTGLLTTVAPTTTTAGFRLNPGTAPTVPTNGDIWTTSAGLYVQVNGSTVGPLSGPTAGSFAGTSPITVSFPAGVVTYAFDFSVANVFTARQTINLNGTATPTPITGAGFVVNPANATVGRVQVNAYGAIASFTGAIYAGTAAAPTQVLSGTQLTGINAYAYTGSALVGPIGSFRLYAAENITATAWGTKACIATVPLTTAVLTDSLCQQNSGGVTIGSPTGGDKGAGTLNSAGTIYINGSALSASAANLTVGTSTITGGTTTNILRNSAGVLAEYTITGTGTVVAMQTSPSFVTPALGVATGTSVAIGGCTLGTSALCTTGNVVVGSGSFGLSGNISVAAWTTSGVRYKNVAATLTDTSSSGTVATAYTDVFGGNTIAASSVTTFTNYFTHYISGPTAGTNVTFTNSWALGADSAKIGTSNQMTVSTAGVVAVGGSLAIAGCTIGTNALCATGTANISGNFTASGLTHIFGSTNGVSFNVGTGGTGANFANIIVNGSSLAANGAYITFQSNSVAKSYVGRDAAITGAGSSDNLALYAQTGLGINMYTNNGTLALSISSAQLVALPQISSDATHTDSTVCQDTTTHALYAGSGALGVCLGTSGRQFKTEITPMLAGLDDLMKVDFINYRYRTGYGDGGARKQYGTTAQNVEAAIPDLARQNANGETINFDSGALLFVGLRAIQQLKADNDNLRAEIETLKRASR